MIEIYGNLWDYPADFRIITTNGFVTKLGKAVMGRGCALEAAIKYPELPYQLGSKILESGNHCYLFQDYNLITFPVKDKWFESALPILIEESVDELLKQFINSKFTYVMPRAGCGNGKLIWLEIKPLLEKLPDNVAVIHFG